MYKDLIRVERNTDAKFTIIEWTLGNKCTYACSYCPAILHDGSVGWQDHKKLTGFLDICHEHYSVGMGREVLIQYTGGEPTVYPKFKELLKHARDMGIRQSIRDRLLSRRTGCEIDAARSPLHQHEELRAQLAKTQHGVADRANDVKRGRRVGAGRRACLRELVELEVVLLQHFRLEASAITLHP